MIRAMHWWLVRKIRNSATPVQAIQELLNKSKGVLELRKLLNEGDSQLRARIADAVVLSVPELLENPNGIFTLPGLWEQSDDQLRARITDAVVACPTEQAYALIRNLLNTERGESSCQLLTSALLKLSSAMSREPLIEALQGKCTRLFTNILKGLIGLNEPRTVALLISVLSSGGGDEWDRARIVRILGDLSDPRASATLRTILGSEEPSRVQEAALEALIKLKNPSSAEAMARAMGKYYLRDRAAGGLAILGRTAIPYLVRVLESEAADGIVAARAIAKIGGGDARAALVRLLISPPQSRDGWMLQEIADALASIGDAESLAVVSDWKRDQAAKRAQWRHEQERLLPDLLARARTGSPDERQSAISKMGWTENASAVPHLLGILKRQEDKYVLREAADALSNILSTVPRQVGVSALREVLQIPAHFEYYDYDPYYSGTHSHTYDCQKLHSAARQALMDRP